MKQKKVKTPPEPQYYKSATNQPALNYQVYYLSFAEKIGYFLLAFAVGAAVGYLFYGGIGTDEFGRPTTATYILNAVVSVTVGTIAGVLFLPLRRKQIIEKRQKTLKTQFRDMLQAFSTSLCSGKNVSDSFLTVYVDLKTQYEETADIINELKIINDGIANGINVEDLLEDLGKRSGCVDIENFANVFKVCYRKGGNINDTIRNTYEILSGKMEISNDITTAVTGSRSELYMMLAMPIILIAMIKLISSEFAANFVTPAGIAATTIAIVLFAVSYFIGKSILNIKV